MSTLLRVEMILVAVVLTAIIVRSINRGRLRVQYALVWLLIAFLVLIAAVFPGVVFWLCRMTGIQTPTNLLYLLGILALLLLNFNQSIVISRQSDRITRLIQTVSIRQYEESKENDHDAQRE